MEAEMIQTFNYSINLFNILRDDFKFCLKTSKLLIKNKKEKKILSKQSLNIDIFEQTIFRKAFKNLQDPGFITVNRILTDLKTNDNDSYMKFTKEIKKQASLIDKLRINYFEREKDTFETLISLSNLPSTSKPSSQKKTGNEEKIENDNINEHHVKDNQNRSYAENQLCYCLITQQIELLNLFTQFITFGKAVNKIINVLASKEEKLKNLLSLIQKSKQSSEKLQNTFENGKKGLDLSD